ncbi:hypothetical protein M422DRAFT_276345 [Sphaerobolus stellatus SS14]|uniref:Uncharacterized protein n=1 Tax=Sphaerobolus stellatus (strain SS14) TaxID=990650 RepID=A0A0C9T2V5_SPHS4|nr:hypothetical protein M422DRAFT_276345 [Sphaerobolus stellatus SS14]
MAPMAKEPGQKGFSWSNITVVREYHCFACLTLQTDYGLRRHVTTLGQPLESRGGALGFYQGLIPWARIEASPKGAVLIFTASEVETATINMGINPGLASLLGGMTSGIAQVYATMGFCTTMKTTEITRHKQAQRCCQSPYWKPRDVQKNSTYEVNPHTVELSVNEWDAWFKQQQQKATWCLKSKCNPTENGRSKVARHQYGNKVSEGFNQKAIKALIHMALEELFEITPDADAVPYSIKISPMDIYNAI